MQKLIRNPLHTLIVEKSNAWLLKKPLPNPLIAKSPEKNKANKENRNESRFALKNITALKNTNNCGPLYNNKDLI